MARRRRAPAEESLPTDPDAMRLAARVMTGTSYWIVAPLKPSSACDSGTYVIKSAPAARNFNHEPRP
jgi:hypothetical protein